MPLPPPSGALRIGTSAISSLITGCESFGPILFAPQFNDWGPTGATIFCLVLGTCIGLINGVLVTILKVPSFIATLTMLLIGRGIILGLTGGRSIGYAVKARDYPWFFHLGETNALGFNNQIP